MKVAALFVLAIAAVVAAKQAVLMHGPPGELPSAEHIRNQQVEEGDANMVTYSGSTRFRPRFWRPEIPNGVEGCPSQPTDGDEADLDKARWSAAGFSVSQTGSYSIMSAQRFDGAIFIYQDVFVPGNSYGGDGDDMCVTGNDEDPNTATSDGIFYSAINDIELKRGKRYILVTTGVSDSDRGRFQNYIWGPAGAMIHMEEKGCAQVGCDDDSFTDTCACDDMCESLCDCCHDWCDECAEAVTDEFETDTCGNVKGDPHYYGFGGEFFNVKGEVGKIYNLLSDAGVQVNAKYDFGCKPETTVLGEIGVVFETHELKFDVNGVHQLNGDELSPAQKEWLNEEQTAWAERFHNDGLRVVTPEYTVTARTTESKCGLHHIDVSMQARNPNSSPHGLLGQTRNSMRTRSVPDAHNSPEQGAGFIEGIVTEYEVQHLFAKDHVYSRFNSEKPSPVESKRQH